MTRLVLSPDHSGYYIEKEGMGSKERRQEAISESRRGKNTGGLEPGRER